VNQIGETASPVAPAARTASIALVWDLMLAGSLADASESDLGRVRSLLGKAAPDRPVDWEAVLRLSDEHGTSSLVYQNLLGLGDAVPAPVLESLRQRYERNVHKSLFLSRELIRILD